MEYANNGNLQTYLENNFEKLNWNDKKQLAYQIADGLNYLHNEDVLHRDLHSKNIVIHDRNAKITDFGISKIEYNSSMHIGPFGKTAYMEPQILADQNFEYIKASDIYSFGILMWEISSGQSPFENKFNNNQDLIIAITCYETREISIADTPDDYEKLYKKCWKQEPEQRPIIKEVLKRFSKMGFGKNIGDDESTKENNSDPDSNIGDSIQLNTFENLSISNF
ncbi:16693_t:CDS:2 [Funneliformis geosporum]|uniref:16693_t:CDS:1 n=1 Tax=Funneliformis geosporum TaxID=1117311 RepID=A0A9W4SAA4_9GLOM|nr:16693_t:CDS:2 [Funneliformis geosporum]